MENYGGQYVPIHLKKRLDELEEAYNKFSEDLNPVLKDFVGRPTPLYLARNLSKKYNCKIYFKREDLNHTGAHKINNTIGQAFLAKKMGKTKIIAETGAGQHGVATATAAALLGLNCKIFMGKTDADKQQSNVAKIKLLGAEIQIVQGTLKDAVDAALAKYIRDTETFYLIGSVVGPHPYPTIVRDFQKIIGKEAKKQILEKEQRLPDRLIACIGGGSNAIGLFHEFLDDNVKMTGVEPAGKGISTGKHAATLTCGTPGIIHGFKCYLLQENGEPKDVYSIASGLDYPGVGPEHCVLKDAGRINTKTITDKEAMDAFIRVSREEGIIPALETSHALAYGLKTATPGEIMIINFSGRGDKDLEFTEKYLRENK